MQKQNKTLWVFVFLVLLFPSGSFSQRVEVSVNRNNILIGEHINFGLKVLVPEPGLRVHFMIPDSVPHFDIISKGEVKTLPGNPPSLEQVITFTSFDSGSWVFPSIPVMITDGRKRINLSSSTVLVQVGYSPEDTTGIYDIKPIRQVTITDNSLYYILAGILLALILAWLIYRYIKKQRAKPKPVFDTNLSPKEEAFQALHELESTPPQVKEFYTTLASIFKRYYSRRKQTDLVNKTTGDLLLQLQTDQADTTLISMAAEPLRLSDAVKYAKYKPGSAENQNAVGQVRQLIDQMEKLSLNQ